jgi:3-oxoacyl-[acyl-carrier protein] reductase
MIMSENFKNKVALITGASGGIGLATAEKLANLGCSVILVGRDIHKLNEAQNKLVKYNVVVDVQKADVIKIRDIKTVHRNINKKFGKIDYLVNSAGISIPQKQGVLDENIFDSLINVNLKGTYISCMLFGYELIKNGGAIVNVGSVRGRTGTDSFSSGYAASKAGVINLTKSFALELAERNIKVNCVAPGAIYPTEMSKSWNSALRKSIAENIPLKRLGKPKEVANVICFLLSEESNYITGQTIDVNGGLWTS